MWVWGVLGCAGPKPQFVSGPTIAAADLAPLSAELLVETDLPTRLRVELRGDDVDLSLELPALARVHRVPVHGTRPDREIEVIVTAEAATGRQRTERTTFRTRALPDDLPRIDVRHIDPDRVLDGWILLPLRSYDDDRSWLVAVDPRDGEVAWAYTGGWPFGIVRPTPDGTLLGMPGPTIVEIDLFGREVRRWSGNNDDDPGDAVRIDATTMHHDVLEHEGTLAVLTKRPFDVPEFPESYEDPEALVGPVRIEDNALSLFDAETGERTAYWPLADRLDTARIGFDSLNTKPFGIDWVHANAVVPYRDGWIVECRHQDALVHLAPDGEVRWILSNPAGWRSPWRELLLDGPDAEGWAFHPHGPSFDADGNLMVLDNHNHGHAPYTPPPDEPPRSRVVAWSIDDDARTATTAWTWTPPGELFSNGLGNVVGLPDGDVLADFPLLTSANGVSNEARGRGRTAVRVFQITPGRQAPALDLEISTDLRTDPEGVKAYRAFPIPTFWDADVVVERR